METNGSVVGKVENREDGEADDVLVVVLEHGLQHRDQLVLVQVVKRSSVRLVAANVFELLGDFVARERVVVGHEVFQHAQQRVCIHFERARKEFLEILIQIKATQCSTVSHRSACVTHVHQRT